MKISDIRKFKPKIDRDLTGVKFTFGKIDVKKIKDTMNERLQLVLNKTPRQREQTLRQYFMPN